MTNKKVVVAVLLLSLFIILSLVACNNAGVQPTHDNTTMPKKTVVRTATPTATEMATPTPTPTPAPTEEVVNTESNLSTIHTLPPSATISKTPATVKTQTPKREPPTTPKVTVAPTTVKKVVNIPTLAVRKYAGTEYSVLGYLEYKDVITIKGTTSDGWHKITFNGRTGYVDGKCLTNYPYQQEAVVTDTPMWKYTPTPVPTPMPTSTEIPTGIPTELPTETPVETSTEAPTGISTETPMETPAETVPATETPTSTPTPTPTPTPERTGTPYYKRNFVDPYEAYTYKTMMTDIAQMTQYYNFIETGSIGTSFLGKDIPYLKLGNGTKKLFICASMHAREYITTSYIMEVLETYAYYYANDMTYGGFAVKDLLDTYSLWVVPMVNPDGVSIVTDPDSVDLEQLAGYVGSNWVGKDILLKWKANGRGVDINRNFDLAWEKLSNGTTLPAYMNYKGPSAASEPETKAIASFCKKYYFAAAISLHTKGEVVYWEDSYAGTISKAEDFTDAICNLTGYIRIPTTTSVSGYAGGFENWFRATRKRPALCVELTPSNGTDLPHDPSEFDTLVWEKAKYLPLIAIEALL